MWVELLLYHSGVQTHTRRTSAFVPASVENLGMSCVSLEEDLHVLVHKLMSKGVRTISSINIDKLGASFLPDTSVSDQNPH